jgi:tRNA threonylcarbamoyladenosine modification (KEOPS) complex  Pcc1 subunit
MSRIVLELSSEEASIVYRALVEQFKEWVFSRLEKGVDEESDRMLRLAEGLTSRLEDALTDNSGMRDIINKAIDDADNV